MPHDPRTAVEAQTRTWLERSFRDAMEGLRQHGAPAYDDSGRPRQMTRASFQEVLRKLKVFRWLERLEFGSFLDVGSGFDFVPNLVRARYGVPAYYSDLVHAMNMPTGGAEFGRLDHAVTINLASLPFPDQSFDVVLASEVLEHLVRPVEAITELLRVTRKALIMTSLEALSAQHWRRWLAHHLVDVRVPHVERNFFLLDEFTALFGPDLHHENLLHALTLPADPFRPEVAEQAAYARLTEVDTFADALCRAASFGDHGPAAMGIVLVKTQPGVVLKSARSDGDPALARWLIAETARAARAGMDLLVRNLGPGAFAERDRPIAPSLLARLCCPDCRRTLVGAGAGVRCTACGAVFGGDYGVPILAPTRVPDLPEEERIRRLVGDDAGRARTVRRLMRRLRRNEAPAGPLRRLTWRLARRFV